MCALAFRCGVLWNLDGYMFVVATSLGVQIRHGGHCKTQFTIFKLPQILHIRMYMGAAKDTDKDMDTDTYENSQFRLQTINLTQQSSESLSDIMQTRIDRNSHTLSIFNLFLRLSYLADHHPRAPIHQDHAPPVDSCPSSN